MEDKHKEEQPLPDPVKNVWAADEHAYGEKYTEHLLEQYKLFAETTCSVAEERGKASTFFLTGHTALITAYGVAAAYSSHWLWRTLVPVVGILLSWVWWALLVSYGNLNRGKFDVLREMETKLPAALYRAEWDVLERGETKRYRPLTRIEVVVAWIFGLLYGALLLIALFEVSMGGARTNVPIAEPGSAQTSNPVKPVEPKVVPRSQVGPPSASASKQGK